MQSGIEALSLPLLESSGGNWREAQWFHSSPGGPYGS